MQRSGREESKVNDSLWKSRGQKEVYVPFFVAFLVCLIAHAFVFLNKLPNADAMDSFWFDQNMVTSGRWFLTIACGISSYYDLNWINGLLSAFYLGSSAVVLTDVMRIRTMTGRVLVSALLVTFPAITATFAYLYTADGYMLGYLFAILAVYIIERFPSIKGVLLGGMFLSLSIGTYQAYVAVTILLCLFLIVRQIILNNTFKQILKKAVLFLSMGVFGGVLYYVILKICLALQHKQLDTYQGINNMGKISISALPEAFYKIFRDFAAFAIKGNIFVNNGFSLVCMLLLLAIAFASCIFLFIESKAYRKWYSYLLLALVVLITPMATNIILLISSDAYYHLLMRMQWGLFPIMAFALAELALTTDVKTKSKLYPQMKNLMNWIVCVALSVMIFNFIVTDNIAYFNMNERYEKTYAYCVRLVDRIEQTPGYQPGVKVAMIGVVNETEYPKTDITGEVTAGITGTTGDILLYKGMQYREFMKHYLNFSIELVSDEDMLRIYDSEEYQEMESFPASDSVKMVDGVLYIKTE